MSEKKLTKQVSTRPKKKEKWKKPKLIVLVRGRPEESVLVGCKNAVLGGGPVSDWDNCWFDCGGCDDLNLS